MITLHNDSSSKPRRSHLAWLLPILALSPLTLDCAIGVLTCLASDTFRATTAAPRREAVWLGAPALLAAKGYKRFGAERVRDTPISEAVIAGAAVGAALSGLRPVVEIMFMDFVTLAMDPIVNQAAKARFMFGGQGGVPMVVRLPHGGGVNAGPQHSQCLEAWFAHVPGLKVVCPHTAADAYGLAVPTRRNSWGPNYLRFGLQLQNDFEGNSSFNAAMRGTLAEITRYGGEWVWDVQVGETPLISTEANVGGWVSFLAGMIWLSLTVPVGFVLRSRYWSAYYEGGLVKPADYHAGNLAVWGPLVIAGIGGFIGFAATHYVANLFTSVAAFVIFLALHPTGHAMTRPVGDHDDPGVYEEPF